MFNNNFPFDGADKSKVIYQIYTSDINTTLHSKEWASFSESAKEVLWRGLEIDPDLRASASSLLKLSWFSEQNYYYVKPFVKSETADNLIHQRQWHIQLPQINT